MRYIGTYIYKDIEKENAIPAIIDKDLFETVQRRLSLAADAPARGKAKVDYLLSGKLFCGHCGAAMHGESGTSKTGAIHNYYTCYSRKRRKGCNKKPLKKDFIERVVAQDAMALLTDDVIEELADMAMSQADRDLKENTRIPELSARLTEIEQGINNITKAVEKGIASDALLNRLTELEKEKKVLTSQLREEEKYICRIDRDQIIFWLTKFQGGDIEDEDCRRRIIDLLVNSVTVWDEPDGYKITTAYNLTSCKTKTFRVSNNADSPSGEGFGFGELSSTIAEPDEPAWFVWLFVMLKDLHGQRYFRAALSGVTPPGWFFRTSRNHAAYFPSECAGLCTWERWQELRLIQVSLAIFFGTTLL